MAKLPTVAIVGRPNVGKSTLFNRLVGKKLALVDDRPGVTRDRREGEASLLGLDFRVIDTAGYEDEDPDTLPGRMRAQTIAAVRDADVALFLIDARAGVTPLDEEIARWLRSEATPVILAANKAEGNAGETGMLEAYALGLGEAIAISAEHGEGIVDLFEHLRPHVERDEDEADEAEDEGDPTAEARHRRPAQCRQIDADQPDARRGTADHRAGGRDHPRFDRDRLGLAGADGRGPAGAADRHGRHAQEGEGRRQAGEAVRRRRPPRGRFRRGRRAAARRHARARGAGSARSPTMCSRRAGR